MSSYLPNLPPLSSIQATGYAITATAFVGGTTLIANGAREFRDIGKQEEAGEESNISRVRALGQIAAGIVLIAGAAFVQYFGFFNQLPGSHNPPGEKPVPSNDDLPNSNPFANNDIIADTCPVVFDINPNFPPVL